MTTWEGRLVAEGCRVTSARRAVAEVLLETDSPISPQEILERAHRLYPRLGLATVYRALALFEDMDLVRRIHRDDGCHVYLRSSPGHNHALICRSCGRTVEFAGGDDLEDLIEGVQAVTGFEVDGHLLQLEGLCPDCRGE